MKSLFVLFVLLGACGSSSSSSPDLLQPADLTVVDQAVATFTGDSSNPSDCPASLRSDQITPPTAACTGTPIEKCKYGTYTCVCLADDQKLHCS